MSDLCTISCVVLAWPLCTSIVCVHYKYQLKYNYNKITQLRDKKRSWHVHTQNVIKTHYTAIQHLNNNYSYPCMLHLYHYSLWKLWGKRAMRILWVTLRYGIEWRQLSIVYYEHFVDGKAVILYCRWTITHSANNKIGRFVENVKYHFII